MKKILIYSAVLLVAFGHFSCNDEIPQTLQDEYVAIDAGKTALTFLRVGDGQPVESGIRVMLIAAQKSAPVNYTFEILSTSTAKENVQYKVTGANGSIPANSSFGNLPIQVLPDNINPGEAWTLNIKLKSADLKLANDATVSFKIQVSCQSNLQGKLDYVLTNYFCNEPDLTGTTELKKVTGTSNEYKIDDFVFGSWDACYGPGSGGALGSDPAVTLRIVDICNKISVAGNDQYGDTYTYKIVKVDGSALTIDWSNTYGEFGTVTLTRQDGASWPALSN